MNRFQLKDKFSLFIIAILLVFISIPFVFSQPRGKGIVCIEEEDGSPSIYPWKIKVTNATATDNQDGTASLSITGTTAWDDISDPDAASEVDFADYVTELKLGSSGDFRIGDGGSDYTKFTADGVMSFAGNAVFSGAFICDGLTMSQNENITFHYMMPLPKLQIQ